MNKVIISGNITKDAELRYLPGGDKATLKFCVAVSRGFKREDGTDFINCTLWGKRAESLAAYIVKGTFVEVTGALRINKKDDKYYTEIRVDDIELVSKGKGAGDENTVTDNNFDVPDFSDVDAPW